MKKEIMAGMILAVVLVGTLTLAFDVVNTGESRAMSNDHSSSVFYQPPTVQWNKTYGGAYSDYTFSAVHQTSDQGYIVAGTTQSFGAGSNDFWLVKTDSAGNHQWDKTYGGIQRDEAFSVQQTSDGGYIVAGMTESFGAGGGDFWLVKTDSSGNHQWNKTYGGTNPDYAYSVQQTSDGGYIVVGRTGSFGVGNDDFWLVKTDSAGNMMWNKAYGGTNVDYACSVLQTGDGGYIVVGLTESFGVGFADIWLVKTDSAGNHLWNHTYGGTDWDSAWSVQQASDGGYIVGGITQSFGAGSNDFWLIKTDSFGNNQWNKTYGGTAEEDEWSAQQTSDGGYIAAGYTFGAGNADIWLVKTDSTGNMMWNRTYGGSNHEYAFSVQQTSDGGYIVSGYVEPFGGGMVDIFLVKLAPEAVMTTVDGETILIERNVTITKVVTTKNTLHFWASGPTGETGYINVTFPVGLNTTAIKVFIDGKKITPQITTNSTHYFIYFTFTLSAHEITIEYAQPPVAGGIWIPVDKLALLAPYISSASAITLATVATAIYIKRTRHGKEKQ